MYSKCERWEHALCESKTGCEKCSYSGRLRKECWTFDANRNESHMEAAVLTRRWKVLARWQVGIYFRFTFKFNINIVVDIGPKYLRRKDCAVLDEDHEWGCHVLDVNKTKTIACKFRLSIIFHMLLMQREFELTYSTLNMLIFWT